MSEAKHAAWISRARDMLTSASARSGLVVACGQGAQALASLATTILLSRRLGPSGYGVFSVALGAATTAAPIMDFGMAASLLRQAARAHADKDTAAIARFVQAYVQIKFVLFLVVGGAGVALSGWLARDILRYPHPTLLRCACAGAVGLNLLTFGRGLLEARQSFKDVAFLTAGASALRLILVVGLIAIAAMNPGTALLAYLAAPALGLAYALRRLRDIPFLRNAGSGLAFERRTLLSFGGWAGVFAVFSSLASYVDIVLVNRWCDPVSVGLYAAAYKLAFVMITASYPFGLVLRARASGFKTIARLDSFLAKARIMPVLAALGVAAVWIAAPLAVRVCFGAAYAPSAPLLRILALGTGCMFAGGPFLTAFYALGRAKPLAAYGFAQLIFFVVTLWLLVPRYGITGAAWAFALTHGLLLALTLVMVRAGVESGRAEEAAALHGGDTRVD